MDTLPKEGTLLWELMKAHTHAANVLTHLYSSDKRTNRSWLWRGQMLRAEGILMKLMVRELAKRDQSDDDLPQPEGPDPMTRQT